MNPKFRIILIRDVNKTSNTKLQAKKLYKIANELWLIFDITAIRNILPGTFRKNRNLLREKFRNDKLENRIFKIIKIQLIRDGKYVMKLSYQRCL